jgi:hypothetical protein
LFPVILNDLSEDDKSIEPSGILRWIVGYFNASNKTHN